MSYTLYYYSESNQYRIGYNIDISDWLSLQEVIVEGKENLGFKKLGEYFNYIWDEAIDRGKVRHVGNFKSLVDIKNYLLKVEFIEEFGS